MRHNIKSLSHALLYSFIVYKYVILVLRKDTFRENWLIFWGIWGEAELFLGIWGAKANTFREMRTLFAGRRGDQYIIFRDQGSTDPWGPHYCSINKTPLVDSYFFIPKVEK